MFIGKHIVYQRWTLLLVAVSLAACTPRSLRTENTPVLPTALVCQPSRIQESPNSFPEIQATMNSEGEIWALLFFDEAHANEELKIVWRIDAPEPGTEVQFQAHNEEGTIVQPIWGPTFHPESTWERPGLEWGTGFNFPEPGCWTITATLGTTKGEIRLEVLDS